MRCLKFRICWRKSWDNICDVRESPIIEVMGEWIAAAGFGSFIATFLLMWLSAIIYPVALANISE